MLFLTGFLLGAAFAFSVVGFWALCAAGKEEEELAIKSAEAEMRARAEANAGANAKEDF